MRRERWPTFTGVGTYNATITASGSAHTKGSYTEIAPATGFDGVLEYLLVAPGSALGLMDLAIGAAGSEQIVVANIMRQGVLSGGFIAPQTVPIPLGLALPAGTRLSARCQAATGSQTQFVAAYMASAFPDRPRFKRSETLGVNTGTSRGTSIDPGGVAHTKGAYVELASATAFDHCRWLVLWGNQANATPSACTWMLDLAIGAAAAEQIVAPDLYITTTTTAAITLGPSAAWVLDVAIPTGSRVAARAAGSNVTDATDRLIDVSIIALA